LSSNGELNKELELFEEGGFGVYKDKYVYAVNLSVDGQGVISKYDTSGNVLKKIKVRKEFWTERGTNEQLLRIDEKQFKNGKKQLLRLNDMTIDKDGQLFLFDGELNVVCKADENGMVKAWFPAVLNEGFDPMIFKPALWKELREIGVKRLDSTLRDTHFQMYQPYSISSTGKLVFVTLLGHKPFGILDLMIINSTNGELSYFKQKTRYNLKEPSIDEVTFRFDLNLAVAFHDSYMFLGKVVRIGGRIEDRDFSIIQKYKRVER
jgi:hypothetical protein